MPRQARIDLPGQLYHVIARGIERGKIFLSEDDYSDFKTRLSEWLKKTGGRCLAWCLMPNHYHFLLVRGERPLAELMRHVMTGYAVRFNLKHSRAGHLFQNRYKAIICEPEEYLRTLVPYIHLNPLRAKLVDDLAGLKKYKWCGHAAALSGAPDGILARQELLLHYGEGEKAATESYMRDMLERSSEEVPVGLQLMEFEGASRVKSARDSFDEEILDDRIIGDPDFIGSVLKKARETDAALRLDSSEAMLITEGLCGVGRKQILSRSREHGVSRARAVYCCLCQEEGNASGVDLAKELGVSPSGISRLASRGRNLLESVRKSQQLNNVPN